MRRFSLFETHFAQKETTTKPKQQSPGKVNREVALRWALIVKKIFKNLLGIKII